ncbi:aromatic compound dioxygenase [Irpex rosettiformis]|uniref:Aromatic compound dioxygenase n=1 Tax=Irpex rosettiformis TaxID=378272 RepID=A0ACB8TZZ5_9APHY|nr:aromatic compound dioxygenase [Irpex rosettiformis]
MAAEAPVNAAVGNGVPPPPFELPYPEKAETITSNVLKLANLVPNERFKFITKNLLTHLHQFVSETRCSSVSSYHQLADINPACISITTEEWMTAIQFLTRTGQTCSPIRQEFILFSDVLGVSALVDALNNPAVNGATESSVLGPFFTEDAPDVAEGGSIASEGKGDYMYVEGRILSTDGTPIPNAIIETWETDGHGNYDVQYAGREKADCRGRLRSGPDGKYTYRAVVPVAYPIPGDGPVGELLVALGRHNMRPNHLHLMVEAPGHQKLVTSLYPEGDEWLASDAVFGVKKSLVVPLKEVNDDEEAKKRGFPKGGSFKLLTRDIVLVPTEESKRAREDFAVHRAKNAAAAL